MLQGRVDNTLQNLELLKNIMNVAAYKFFQNWLRVCKLAPCRAHIMARVIFGVMGTRGAPHTPLTPPTLLVERRVDRDRGRDRRLPPLCLRPYHVETTGTRPISEVKPRRAWGVPRWVTTWES